jgi:V/A-type H+/Na+-transporting ATPase subunit D
VTPVVRNKTSLARWQRDLGVYRQVLPSLDLKRRQLIGMLADERRALRDDEARLEQALEQAARRLPMLAHWPARAADTDPLTRTVGWPAGAEAPQRWLGVAMPALEPPPRRPAAAVDHAATPVWFELAVQALGHLAALRDRVARRRERLQRLAEAVRRAQQRVNLFEQRLVPQAEAEVRAIRIALADLERAAIVRSKGVLARRERAAGG